MSDMSMAMFGIGVEAFDDTPPASDYVRVVVDTAELIGVDNEFQKSNSSLSASITEVSSINDTRVYAESMRGSISETSAIELQNRVMAVVGSERAALIVGSVESYNGAIGEQILNASLESIGGMLQKALAYLIKLIRTGAQIMLRFFSSAKLVLGRQLTAVNELRRSIGNKLEGWEEFQISIADGVTVKYSKPGNQTNDNVVSLDFGSADEGDISPMDFYRVHASMISMTVRDHLIIPSPFVQTLKDTVRTLTDVITETAIGYDKHYACVLEAISDASKMPEANRLDALSHLTLDKFLPLSKMLADKTSNEYQTRYSSAMMLGDYQMRIAAPPTIMFAARGKVAQPIDVVNGFSAMSFTLQCVEPQRKGLTGYVPSLSRSDSLKVLDIAEELLKRVINSGLDKWAADLSREADMIASRVLPRMYGGNYNDDDYRTALVQALGTMTRITSAVPRDTVAYSNRLTNAIKHYVELSGKL